MKKDLFSTSIARILLIGFSLGQGIIIARYLLEEGKGIIGLYVAALNLTLSLGDMGGKQAYSFFITKKGMELRSARDYMQWSLIGAVIFEAIFLASVIWLQGLANNTNIVSFLFGIMTLKLYNSYSMSFALGLRDFTVINGSQLLNAAVTLAGVIVFIALLGKDVEYFFVALLMGNFATTVFLAKYRKRIFSGFSLPTIRKVSFVRLKEITFKGFTYAISLFVMGLNYRLDLFLLDYFKEKSDVGIYSQGASLAQMLWLLPEVVALVIFSHSLNVVKEKEFAKDLLKYVGRMMLVMGGLLIPIGVIAFYLIPIFYGKAFADSSWVFILILPGVYAMILFKMLNGDLAARGHPLVATYVFAPAVILNVILNLLLIPQYSGFGAATASCVSYCIAAVTYLLIYRRMTSQLKD